MQELASWRELLGKIIADSHERQRIANMLGVNPITLTRWVNNESKPRPQNLRQLPIDIMMQARRNSQPIHLMEAEQLVWQQIEEELVQSSLSVADKSVENNQEV
jgi:hypothetical protein